MNQKVTNTIVNINPKIFNLYALHDNEARKKFTSGQDVGRTLRGRTQNV